MADEKEDASARAQAVAQAEAADRVKLRELAEKIAPAARRKDKAAVIDEIVHALARVF